MPKATEPKHIAARDATAKICRGLIVGVVLVASATGANAQGGTFYDAKTGKVIARSATDTQGTTTTFGADGRVISRETRSATRKRGK